MEVVEQSSNCAFRQQHDGKDLITHTASDICFFFRFVSTGMSNIFIYTLLQITCMTINSVFANVGETELSLRYAKAPGTSLFTKRGEVTSAFVLQRINTKEATEDMFHSDYSPLTKNACSHFFVHSALLLHTHREVHTSVIRDV